jgi:AcrR family transcriptional regulator
MIRPAKSTTVSPKPSKSAGKSVSVKTAAKKAVAAKPSSAKTVPAKVAAAKRKSASGKATGENAADASNGLSEAQIVKVARAIIAEVGVKGLTMRRLSTDLDVALGATYHHVSTKHGLLTLVARDLYAEVVAPDVKGTWNEKLKTLMVSQATVIARYPGMGNFMMTHVDELVPTELNQLVRKILVDGGFAEREMTVLMGAMFFYVTGMSAGGFAAPTATMFRSKSVMALFEEGLEMLLAGADVRRKAELANARKAARA